MDVFQKTTEQKLEKIGGTLPITCQICLGKVHIPVICPNQHVFCSGCMEAWLQRIQQCPTCRTPITQPPKPILGGKYLHEPEDSFSNRNIRKTRVELLFKEYETEISQLEQKVSSYSRENEALHARLKQSLQGTAGQGGGSTAADNAVLKALTEKLEKMTSRYNNATQEMEAVKKEKTIVQDKNVELHRETQRLRLELSSRSPRRYGRSTVTALESRVETYQKQVKQLEKALERSDGHIEYLEGLLKDANISKKRESKSSEAKKSSRNDKPFEELPSTLSEISEIAPEPKSNGDQTFDLEMPSPMHKARVKDPEETMDESYNDTIEGTPVEHAKKKLRFGQGEGNDSLFEKPAQRKDNLNVSMTPELEDCMRILEEAERKVAQSNNDRPPSQSTDYVTKAADTDATANVFTHNSAKLNIPNSGFSSTDMFSRSDSSQFSSAPSMSLNTHPIASGMASRSDSSQFSSAPSMNLNAHPLASGMVSRSDSSQFSSAPSVSLNMHPVASSAHSSMDTRQDLNTRPRSQEPGLMFTSSSHEFSRGSSRDLRPGQSLSQDTNMFREPYFPQQRPSSRDGMFSSHPSLSQGSFPSSNPSVDFSRDLNARGTGLSNPSTSQRSVPSFNTNTSTAAKFSAAGSEFNPQQDILSQLSTGSAAGNGGHSLSQPSLSSFPGHGVGNRNMNGGAAGYGQSAAGGQTVPRKF